MTPYNKLTNQDIDNKLEGTHFKRLGEYVNNCTPIEFFCLKHNNVFKTTWGNLNAKCKKGTGCSECVKEKLRLSNDIIDERLKGRNIKRIGNYITANEKIEWELDDGYRWFSTPANVLTKTNFKKERKFLSNEIIDQRLKDRSVKRLGDYVSKSLSKLQFLCLKCNHKWSAIVNNVVNKEYGCPACCWGKEESFFKNFIENNIAYDYFNDHETIYLDDRILIPDFFLIKESRKIIVEYNGIQHYKSVPYFGGDERFEKQKERDEILRNYCSKNKIELYELPYYINREDNMMILKEKIGGKQSL